jgi:two-component system, response regulator YesN
MLKYLIVDDEPLIRKGLIKLISRVATEWEVCAQAWDGKEGIEMAVHYRPDLILTDIRMPEMDGLTMCKQLIEHAVSIPVVFITGHDEFTYIQQAVKNKAFDYLLKPIKESDVSQLFDRYEREFGAKKHPQQKDMSMIKEYEFYLLNTLESQNPKGFEILGDWYNKLQDMISLRSFIDLTMQIVNSYLLKFDMIGYEFKPVINESNTSNVIQKLQESIAMQLDELHSQNENQVIEKVKQWIESHVHENLSLTEAADLVHLNSTYFSEYFKKNTGETFSKYVIRYKMEKAKALLTDYSLRVSDVAIKVGYSDHRHFSKVFQLKVGMTPTEYRNKILGIRS